MNAISVLNAIRWRPFRYRTGPTTGKVLKHILMTLLVAAGAAGAFGQGKVALQNDLGSAITLSSNSVPAADAGVMGQPIATTGPLPSGIVLMVGLYGGTSSSALSFVSGVMLNPVGGTGEPAGMIPTRHIVLPFAGGVNAFFQVKVWDSTYTDYENALAAGSYIGENNIFSMTPGTSIVYYPINGSGGSTWTAVGNETPLVIGGGGGYPDFIVIYSQPVSQTVVRGGTTSFAVGAYSILGYPLSYQWLFNGAGIPGAINSWYQITNVQPANAGTYRVLVWDFCGCGEMMSAPVTLTVLPVPPTILTPPQSQTAELGAGVGLDVTATGDSPLIYQWFFNATNAFGKASTNSHLQLANVQFAHSGAYSVVVTNGGGAVTSPPALLSVIPVVERHLAADLSLNGAINSVLNLDYTPLLDSPINWFPLDTVILTNSSQPYIDASSPLAPVQQRFYRAWQTNQLSPPPILGLNLIPAITLTGAMGATQRVDYINQFGPIDAWCTLATIRLTNTTQLYFDTSVIGQPPRLWRIVPLP